MKKLTHVFALLLVMIVLGCKEQTSAENEKTTENSKEQLMLDARMVEQVVGDIYTAMINRDEEVLEALCSENLTYGHSSGLIQDKETFIDDVINGPFKYINISIEDQSIKILGQTAFVRHVFVSESMNAGEQVNIRIGCIQAYQYNTSGDLQLVIRQAYKL